MRKRAVCIIQARMASTRLPGKTIKPIFDKPMLQLLIERLQRARTLDDVIVAAPEGRDNDCIEDLCHSLGIGIYRGSEDDVLARVLGAARAFNADIIVEITADCPLMDPGLVDAVVGEFFMGGADFVANLPDYTTPRGTDVRVFTTEGLDEINRISNDPADHEHVSLHFWEHPEKYRLRNVRFDFPRYVADLRLTVDTGEDFELIRRIFEALYPENPEFSFADILDVLRANPDWLELNSSVRQKAVR